MSSFCCCGHVRDAHFHDSLGFPGACTECRECIGYIRRWEPKETTLKGVKKI